MTNCEVKHHSLQHWAQTDIVVPLWWYPHVNNELNHWEFQFNYCPKWGKSNGMLGISLKSPTFKTNPIPMSAWKNKHLKWKNEYVITRYKVVSKIFETDAVKIVKLTIRPISHHQPRSSSLPHVDTSPISSIFGTLPGSPFLSECQALFAFQPVSP